MVRSDPHVGGQPLNRVKVYGQWFIFNKNSPHWFQLYDAYAIMYTGPSRWKYFSARNWTAHAHGAATNSWQLFPSRSFNTRVYVINQAVPRNYSR